MMRADIVFNIQLKLLDNDLLINHIIRKNNKADQVLIRQCLNEYDNHLLDDIHILIYNTNHSCNKTLTSCFHLFSTKSKSIEITCSVLIRKYH